MSMRGEPTVDEVLDAMARVYRRVGRDMPFSRVMAQVLTMAGVPTERWTEALGGVGLPDSILLRGTNAYERWLDAAERAS